MAPASFSLRFFFSSLSKRTISTFQDWRLSCACPPALLRARSLSDHPKAGLPFKMIPLRLRLDAAGLGNYVLLYGISRLTLAPRLLHTYSANAREFTTVFGRSWLGCIPWWDNIAKRFTYGRRSFRIAVNDLADKLFDFLCRFVAAQFRGQAAPHGFSEIVIEDSNPIVFGGDVVGAPQLPQVTRTLV